jgi:DNA-binding MarR family transcriptional regulator
MTQPAADARVPDHLHRWLEAAQSAIEVELRAALADQIDQIGLRRLRVLQLMPPGGVRQQDLADAASVTKQSLAESITVLETDGLVERRADPTDRRVWLVVPTPAGQRVQATLDETLEDVERRVADAVGAKRYADFKAVLRSMAAMEPAHAAIEGGTAS